VEQPTSLNSTRENVATLRIAAILWVGVASALLAGCQSHPPNTHEYYSSSDPTPSRDGAPLAISDVSRMLGAGIDDEIIANHVRTNGMMSPLRSEDVAYLEGAGASRTVIDAIQEASPAPRDEYPTNVVYASPPTVVIVEPHPPVCVQPVPTLTFRPSSHFSLQVSPSPRRNPHRHGPHW